ncbi:hypothetical protein EXIGLDRAFT_408083 [Exidia glandulosa HHB12029]|uniref:Uncharacterized protein n=1 Tax=Exidia glandulosa HHB12029 TaxID=1314781 RepID=A0A165KQW8_EXIGL|nr:hypothetical protein EXIGLDRAFT_408083 [Exidia glandulosa HHB12029]
MAITRHWRLNYSVSPRARARGCAHHRLCVPAQPRALSDASYRPSQPGVIQDVQRRTCLRHWQARSACPSDGAVTYHPVLARHIPWIARRYLTVDFLQTPNPRSVSLALEYDQPHQSSAGAPASARHLQARSRQPNLRLPWCSTFRTALAEHEPERARPCIARTTSRPTTVATCVDTCTT